MHIECRWRSLVEPEFPLSLLVQVELRACLRSEGPALSSPVREEGEPGHLDLQRPEGPAQVVAHLRRSGTNHDTYPALTDGDY